MHPTCPHCTVRFERYEGEVTGGMSLSILATSLLFLAGYTVTGWLWGWPLWLNLLFWVGFAIGFPILFYRHSRALWLVLLHLNGDVFWDQEPYQESDRSILDAFLRPPDDEPPPDDDLSPPYFIP